MFEATTDPQIRQAMKIAHLERAKAFADAMTWLAGLFGVKRKSPKGLVAAPC